MNLVISPRLRALCTFFGFFLLPAVCHADLVAHFTFDGGSAADATGNGNTGTIYGATQTEGKLGAALHFDGKDDYVEIPHSSSFDFETNYTISAWIRPETDDGWTALVAKVKDTQEKHFWFVQNDRGIAFEAETTNTSPYIAGGTLRTGAWNHVAVSMDSDRRVKLFVNGQKVAEEVFVRESNADETPINIGRSGGTYNEHHFLGDMDDVRIYDHVLSEEEVRAEALDSYNLEPVLTGLLSANKTDAEPGEPVSFELEVIDPETDAVTYEWHFGDGETMVSDAPEAMHTFESAGRYVVYVHYWDALHPPVRSNPVTLVVGGKNDGKTATLVAHYPFDEGSGDAVLDATGGGSDGTLVGDAARVAGPLGDAISLSGDGHVEIPDTPALHDLSADLTIAAWIQTSDPKQGAGIVMKGGEGDIDKIQFGLGLESGQYVFLWEPRFDTDFGTVKPDDWHHVVVTVRPDHTTTVYIDGLWEGEARGGNDPVGLDAPLRLGRGEFRRRGKLRHFVGALDDVRLYNYAMNPAEVSLLSTGELPVPGPGGGGPGTMNPGCDPSMTDCEAGDDSCLEQDCSEPGGAGAGSGFVPGESGGSGKTSGSGDEGGCGCSHSSSGLPRGAAWILLAAAGAVVARRRQRAEPSGP